MSSQSSGLSSLWPANGVLLGLLVANGRTGRERVALIVGALVGDILASVMRGQTLPVTCLFAIANMMEASLAALMVAAMGGVRGAFERVRDVLAFAAACALAPVVSAVIGAFALNTTGDVPFGIGWLNWYGAATLSLAIVAPAVIVLARLPETLRQHPLAVRRTGEALLVLGLVAAVAFLIFYDTHLPVLFLMLPFVLFATFRLRQFGAVAAIIIVAVISARATVEGHGPIAAHSAHGSAQMILLQLFLAVTFLSSLPVAASLSETDRSREQAHMLADHFKTVVENVDEVIFRADLRGRWTYLNPAWESLSGYSVADSTGGNWLDCLDESERGEFHDWAQPVLAGEVPSSRRLVRFHTGRGETRWMELSIQGLRDMHGQIAGTTGTLRDIDDRKRLEDHVMSAKRRAEEQAREATLLASTDELTGLANRRAFLRHLERQVEAAGEFGWSLSVAIFDVDHFKAVNDVHGHQIGDRVLQRVAERSVGVVRSGDLVGRLGGEEFAILMPGANSETAVIVAERLRAMIEQPCQAETGELPRVTVSVGIASYTALRAAGDLLADADRALYAAKGAGRNQVRLAA